jgi:eukaryotic-like serine/threonine-protein kinase
VATDDDMGSAPTAAGTHPSLTSTPATPASVVANRYEVLGLLGAGGMGRVYRAHDRSLDEIIALKILRRELVTLPGALERFRQEVKLARRVTSPHVVRTFDLGEHGDDHFLTMEYIDGRSLAQLLDAGPLESGEVLRIARAACAGIAAAHTAGILHRDLKPDNVLVAKAGRIAITDFGIARSHADPTATGEGFIGTPAYMAPEQVQGAATFGPAVDVYAFGAILFEMLTGRRPFVGADPFAVALARLRESPPDPRDVRPIAAPLAELVVRCLAREPEARFADGSELGEALAGITDVAGPARTLLRSLPVPAKTSRAIALLPLQATAELAELADGLSEEIVDALTMTRELRIVPLSSVRGAAGTSRDASAIGKALGVDVIVDGSLRKRGDRVRIAARAIGVVDGFQLWANHVDAVPEGLLAASDEVARAIARALTVEIELPARAAPTARAIELYLEGKAKIRTGWFDIGLRGGFEDLLAAYALAPDDPGILATLAIAEARISFLTPETHLPQARRHAEQAVAIAPHSGEAWLALGLTCVYSNQLAEAGASLARAIQQAPGLALAQSMLGSMLLEAGALDQAIAHLEAAAKLDALQPPIADLPRAYFYAGREDEAFAMLTDTKALRPFSLTQIARFRMWRGELYDVAWEDHTFTASMGDFAKYAKIIQAFHRTGSFAPGDRDKCEAFIRSAGPRMRASLMQFMAEHLMFCGEPDNALDYIEQAIAAGMQDQLWMQRCPIIAPLRSSPRFQQLATVVAKRAEEVRIAAGIAAGGAA